MKKTQTILKKSHAKVNLSLEVIEKTPSGFHKLRTVMTKLPNLFDDLSFTITEAKETRVIISTNNKEIPTNKDNICHKTAILFLEKANLQAEIEIDIQKIIPVGAGLGGGSSNAASTFLALNEYFEKPFSLEELAKMASDVGKDVPVFIFPKNTYLMGGFGEIVEEELDIPKFHILLVNPNIHISTATAYGKLKEAIWFMENKSRQNCSKKLFSALKKGETFAEFLYNDFETTVQKEQPQIKELKQALIAFGAENALMSGSGSTVFGIFPSKEELLQAKTILQEQFPAYFVKIG